MLIFEGDDTSGDTILSAFTSDVSAIASSVNAIKSAQSLADAMRMLGDLIGSDVDTGKILDAMDSADGTFDSEELLSTFKKFNSSRGSWKNYRFCVIIYSWCL